MTKFRTRILLVVSAALLSIGGCCPPWSECDPECTITPSRLDFGAAELGTSKELSLEIKNSSGGELEGTVSIACSDFTIVSGGGSFSLKADQTRNVRVRFTPTSEGAKACKVVTGTGTCPDVACTGTGTLAPTCIITPASLAFDSIQVGSYQDLTFDIENTGGGQLAGSVGEDCAGFSVVSGEGAFSLSAGQTRSVTVRYAPLTPGGETCVISTGTPSCTAVTCTGAGKPGAECGVTPDTLQFGAVQIGYREDLIFDVENVGTGVLMGSVSETCGRFSIVSGIGAFALSTGQVHTVTVRYAPTNAVVETCVVDLGTGLCAPVVCMGSGAAGPECQVNPAGIDFGLVQVGSTEIEVVQIRNIGSGTLTGSVSENADHFSIVEGAGDYALESGETHSVTIRFAPTTAGRKTCTVETGSGLCPDVLCVGEATPPPTCQLTPDRIDFGNVEVNTTVEAWVEIENVGGGILSGTITENCYYFSVGPGLGDFSLGPGEIHAFKVKFRPTAAWSSSCNVRTGLDDCWSVYCTGRGVDP